MLLGYNTNGLAHHRLTDAIRLLAESGYRSVAITIDHSALNPYDAGLDGQLPEIAALLRRHNMRSVVETGARFLLDDRHKHEPTLMTADAADRARRVEFLCRAIDIADALRSDCVSLWSGVLRDGSDEGAAWARFVTSLRRVIDHADQRGVVLGFEPEPGMFVDTMHKFRQLDERLESRQLQLTMDVGHLHCLGETPIADQIHEWGPRIVNVHIEDMRVGVHEHLMFGEGEMDFPPIIEALNQVGYQGGLHVELSRHSPDAANAVSEAYAFLAPMVGLPT